MNSVRITYLVLAGLFLTLKGYTQDTTKGYQYQLNLNTKPVSGKELRKQFIIEQSIETIAENSEEDADIDYTTLFDQLSFYYEHPINLNRKNIVDDLQQLRILNDFQINAIKNHIKRNGKLITVFELQSIDLLDQNDIRNILPFITVSKNLDSPNASISEIIKRGRNDIFFRYSRVLEKTAGQREIDDSSWLASENTINVGSPDNLYFRYRFKYLNNLSIGITAEKDAGETFIPNKKAQNLFNQKTTLGFDFYSAHFFLKNVGIFKSLALGDYHVQIGQGLTFWSGLAFGKSSDIMGIKRNALGLRPYSSVDENIFLRGAAAQFEIKKINLLVFGSKKLIDANIKEDSTNTDGDITVSSFQSSGIHSTISNIENKDAISESIGGGEISFSNNNIKIGLASAITHYNGNIERSLSPYSQFQFNSNYNWVTGINYSWILQNFNFFGEISRSDNGGIAQLHGLLASLHSKVSFSALYRNYGKEYQSIFSNAFAESSANINEKGLLTGLNIKLNKKWTLSTYFDLFEFPWLSYQVDAPKTNGYDGFLQLKFKPSKTLEIYSRIRHRNKPYNTDEELDRDINKIVKTDNWYYRFNLNIQVTEAIQLRSRVEYRTYKRGDNEKEDGILILQDILFKPLMSKLSINARFALFDTDSYNSRIYSYENDVLYYYRIPAYYNRGSRTYITVKYKLRKGIDMWIRWSRWKYTNVDVISSGLNEIDGNSKSEIRAQIRFQF